MNKYVTIAQKWAKFSKELLEGRKETSINCKLFDGTSMGEREVDGQWKVDEFLELM